MKQNNSGKIAILGTQKGFYNLYLHEFAKLCNEKNITVDLYNFDENYKVPENIQNHFLLKELPNVKKIDEIKKFDTKFKALTKDKNYDYILTDSMPLSFTSNVFHNISPIARYSLAKNPIYRTILMLGHIKEICHVKNFYKNSQNAIVVSPLMKEDYEKNCNIPTEKIFAALPGSSFAKEEYVQKIKSYDKNSPFVIGLSAVGFVTKGGYVLLESLRVLKKKYPHINFKARIIYPKYKKNKILSLYLNFTGLKNHIELLPYQKNMADFYNSLHCFCCASRFEAFGRVVTEGMSYKLPVIAGSNIGASVIINDGENGFVYKADKNISQNFADKLAYVYEHYNELEQLTENAAATAKMYTWETFAKTIFNKLYPQEH